jgi:hypothetical protein
MHLLNIPVQIALADVKLADVADTNKHSVTLLYVYMRKPRDLSHEPLEKSKYPSERMVLEAL